MALAKQSLTKEPRCARFSDIPVSERILNTVFLLYFIGRIFLLCDLNVTVKRIAVVIPFLAMMLDVLSWFVPALPSFAYVVVASGALMGISMGLQILLSVWQMWFHPNGRNVGRWPAIHGLHAFSFMTDPASRSCAWNLSAIRWECDKLRTTIIRYLFNHDPGP